MSGAHYLRLVPARRKLAPPAAHIAVRISATTANKPFGRSREFRIGEHDFAELIHHAVKMEALR